MAALGGAAEKREPQKAKSRIKGNKIINGVEHIGMSFYIPRETYQRLQLMKIERQTSLQQLVEEAVDWWLAEKNEPPFTPGSKS